MYKWYVGLIASILVQGGQCLGVLIASHVGQYECGNRTQIDHNDRKTLFTIARLLKTFFGRVSSVMAQITRL